jgi:hypothetical protein
MKELIDALEKKNVICCIQRAANIACASGADMTQEALDATVRECLNYTLAEDEELADIFCNFCYEVGMTQLVKALNIKGDPEYKKTLEDVLIQLLACLSDKDE